MTTSSGLMDLRGSLPLNKSDTMLKAPGIKDRWSRRREEPLGVESMIGIRQGTFDMLASSYKNDTVQKVRSVCKVRG